MTAQLYIVPTPVGNLGDISLRAIEVLKDADIIVAEDTRKSGMLLKHLQIPKKRLMAHHNFNEHESSKGIVDLIKAGHNVALVSNAGTPVISDPGYVLVRMCIAENIAVVSLPGPTAFVPALVASGLPPDAFYFEGFLPQKKGRATRIEQLKNLGCTLIFYESPNRVLKTLMQFSEVFGPERKAALCREISKIHEEYLRGSIGELIENCRDMSFKGEFVIVVEGNKAGKKS